MAGLLCVEEILLVLGVAVLRAREGCVRGSVRSAAVRGAARVLWTTGLPLDVQLRCRGLEVCRRENSRSDGALRENGLCETPSLTDEMLQ